MENSSNPHNLHNRPKEHISVGKGEENKSIMPDNFVEKRETQQYFYSKNTIDHLMNSIIASVAAPEELEYKLCLLCVPSLAKSFYEKYGLSITLLEIDDRFSDLPGYKYFDLNEPMAFENKFEFIVFDPPFFDLPHLQMNKAILTICGLENAENIKLIMSFVVREE